MLTTTLREGMQWSSRRPLRCESAVVWEAGTECPARSFYGGARPNETTLL